MKELDKKKKKNTNIMSPLDIPPCLSVTQSSFFFGTGEKKRSLGRDYHPLCLKCQKCNRQLTAGQHAEVWEENGWGICVEKNSENVFK